MLTGDGLDALAEGPLGRDARATGRSPSRARAGGGIDSRERDGGEDGGGDARRDGDRFRRLEAPAARRQQGQAETEGSAHAELCTLTRVRVNV